jgi:2-polyprenyl-3-methyl-5-hydroxy-6-metoxy-1,4-benzoquinol methylase
MNEEIRELRSETCPVCAAAVNEWRTKTSGDGTYRIDRCRSCGFAFVNPRPSLRFLTEYYASFGHRREVAAGEGAPTLERVLAQEQFEPNSTLDARRLVGTVKQLRQGYEGTRFFDVGCGYGFFSKEALRAGFDVVALELAENERRIAARMTGLDPVAIPFEQYEAAPSSISAILMSQILEHAQDVNGWLAKTHRLLQAHGILAIALPNFGSAFRRILQENDPYVTPPEHLNYFSAASLSALLAKHGFGVEKIEWVSRIPRRAFEKRLPKFASPAFPLIHHLSGVSLKALDSLGLGVMLNIYGRKLPA